ncbi:hypothetical protein T492DRAFT_845926 [Pavlovales sp. CCMP2436]|nr:hypothetical protein T492DRAFT_845926 [Pavlovales sp. CCMP2436]
MVLQMKKKYRKRFYIVGRPTSKQERTLKNALVKTPFGESDNAVRESFWIIELDSTGGQQPFQPCSSCAQSNPNELDIRAKGDAVSALSHGGLREEVTPTGNPAAAPHLLPGPIRAPLGTSDRKREITLESKLMQLGKLLVFVGENIEGSIIEVSSISESFRACLIVCLISRFSHFAAPVIIIIGICGFTLFLGKKQVGMPL